MVNESNPDFHWFNAVYSDYVGRKLTGVVFQANWVQLLFDTSKPYDAGSIGVDLEYAPPEFESKIGKLGESLRENFVALIGLKLAHVDNGEERVRLEFSNGTCVIVSSDE